MWLPSASGGTYSRPTSRAVAGRFGGTGCGTSSRHEKQTYHWSALRWMVTVLIVPWIGLLHLTLRVPMSASTNRPSARFQPGWLYVKLSYRSRERKRG